ncbi:helix-turn-helix domain-containing protein [Flavobacterium nitrogenifigens]|uniref:DNA-binding domain-containing protein n=1 Tax=Flavobacterium nitrogenifigens TaxID=1617283 RepID=A0A521B6K4_9FLAO|nr:ATP-binding protein [Flavobacterium nitrogenifigens]KAF2334556.1 ATP-binding protein [Flavobacterium nitrogenifigens]SMO42703.1 Putative DNA-binding domain-containing protein [Flavobacterium nitrogenifigens]
MHKVIEIIKYESESHKADFKKIEYPLGKDIKKNEILKDFSAFANHLSDEEKYIIIGIKENADKSKSVFSVDTPTDESKYRQFINENIEPEINFEYETISYQDAIICFFRLSQNFNRPYLFKKDVKNPITDKPEFKYGDGYIKTGSSTKKIGRKELDDIIENKNNSTNRQEDINILKIFGSPSNIEISKWELSFLDIKIENRSNKSIDLDVEIVIKKSDSFALILEEELLREIKRQESKKTNSVYFPPIASANFIMNNLHLNKEENETEFIVQRNPLKSKFALTLAQNSISENIFQEAIIVLDKQSSIIDAKVIIRSDDFTKGALTKNIRYITPERTVNSSK